MNYYIGRRSYLLSHLLPDINELVDNTIIHFWGPSQESDRTEEIINKMIKTVEECLKLPFDKIIYASSMASIVEPDTLYGKAKKICEDKIIDSGKEYIILRIPRVYGADRRKGLMKKIRENNIDNWDKRVEFCDINDFRRITLENLTEWNRLVYYKTQIRTIREIKDMYNL